MSFVRQAVIVHRSGQFDPPRFPILVMFSSSPREHTRFNLPRILTANRERLSELGIYGAISEGVEIAREQPGAFLRMEGFSGQMLAELIQKLREKGYLKDTDSIL